MDETQKKQNEETNTPKIDIGKLNLTTFPEVKEKKEESNDVFNLDLLAQNVPQINTEVEKEDIKRNVLGTSKWTENKEKREISKLLSDFQMILVSYVFIFIGILGIVGIQGYIKYIDFQNQIQIDEANVDFVQKAETAEKLITKTLGINNFSDLREQSDLLIGNGKDTEIERIKYTTNLNYTEKRLILQNGVSALNDNIIQNSIQLENTKTEIAKYGFIPKELFEMTKKENGITWIRRAMALRENLKFMTAFKVFWYMESFIQSFANYTNLSPSVIESNMLELNQNGEKSIISYTNNCYLNPYEIGSDCNITNDFNNYYTMVDTKSKVGPEFIKELANYVDNKLEEKEIPSYAITFPGFNPTQSTISFTTDINTNNQDELALSKLWIANPHLYIITNLINSLKQSLLVIGEGIKIDQINIVPKTIRIGSTMWTINNSKLRFDLPIQQTDQREISDFFSTESSN